MKRFYIRFLLASIILSFFTVANAQPGCPQVNAGGDVTLPCGTNCTNLTATYFNSGNTSTYGVSSIPYTPFSYTAGTPILVNIDDIWSSVINLPFTFCFFDSAYTQVVVGANGLITFDISEAGGTCAWATTGAPNPTLPTPTLYTNSIMGPYHDIDPSLGGTIKYQIIGTAPCRIFVVSYYQVPMFDDIFLIGSCWGTTEATHQIVLYETTNAIEVYIKDKEACTGWNDGLATLGIQDANGTTAYVAAGRNNNVWNATNEGWRFTPNGPSIVTIDWFNGATPIGTGATVNVCPGSNTTYTAKATYLPCAGGTPVVVTDDVNVNLAGTLQVSTTAVQNVSCFGGTNGSVTVSATTANPPLNYGWTDGPTTLTRNGLSAGTYVFTATDALACTRTDTVVITEPTQLVVNVPDVSQTNCSGAGTGTLTATVTGGTYVYSYAWTGGAQTDSVLNGVAPANYTVTVTDQRGCTASDNATLTINIGGNNVAINNPVVTNVNCFGNNTGSVAISVSGGSGSYTYAWSNLQNTATASALIAGAYSLLVDDGTGCTASATYNITQPTQLVIDSTNVVNIGCSGAVTGNIDVFASGGTPNLNYNWVRLSNSQVYSGSSISGLLPDTYNLTLTDANACSVTGSYQITAVTPLTFTQSQVDPTCNGGSNGTTTISVTTGTAPYNYDWNGTGATLNGTLTGVTAATVNVTITDANCSATATFTLSEPTAVSIALVNTIDVLCNGGNNGAINITTSGGTGAISPGWSNAQTGNAAVNLIAGTYSVIATDQNTCTATASYTINEPTPLVITSADVVTIGCAGGNNGSITAHVAGGTVAYTYSWVEQSNGQTFIDSAITSLAVDNYNLTVTDANACTVTATYAITAITPLTATQSSTNTSCNGGSDGTATVNVTSGTPPYSYSWNGNPATTNTTLTGVSAGTPFVIIADANCTLNINFTITEPSAISITEVSQTAVSCNGGSNGTETVVATGGTPGIAPPYTYLWDYAGQTGVTAIGLPAGSVTVTATDGNNCTASQTFTITEPSIFSASVVTTNAVCYGSPTGSATVTATGGTLPYTYLWINLGTTSSIFGLTMGLYSCTVTDQSGCITTAAGVVNEPADMTFNTSVTPVKCIGDANGTITVDAQGGTSPYTYAATLDGSNFIFANAGLIPGLTIGDYIIIVSDNNGCTKTDTVSVPNATVDSFIASADSTSCYGEQYMDGAAHILTTSIQNGPYQYSVDGGNLQYSGDFYFLTAGAHTIHAVSFNGCESDIPVLVLEPLPILATVNPDTVVLPLGEAHQVQVSYQNATNPSFSWTPAEGLSCIDCANPVASAYRTGDYLVTVSIEHGTSTCYTTAMLHVEVEPHKPVFVPNSFSPNGDGNNDMFLVYGEDIKLVDVKIFNRWGELVYKTNNQLEGWDGTYKGQLQTPQVFTYIAKVTFLNDKKDEKIGTVTLIR